MSDKINDQKISSDPNILQPSLTSVTNQTNNSGDNISNNHTHTTDLPISSAASGITSIASHTQNNNNNNNGQSAQQQHNNTNYVGHLAHQRTRKCVLIQTGLQRHMLEIDDITTMASLYVKASTFLTGHQPEIQANFPTLSNCLGIYREDHQIVDGKNIEKSESQKSSHSSKSNEESKKGGGAKNVSNLAKASANSAGSTGDKNHENALRITLQKVTSIEQIKSNDTLHLIAFSFAFEQKNLLRSLVPHQFEVHSYKTFTYCDYCHDLLWGLMKQGVKCKLCKRNYHKRCANLLGNDCPGAPLNSQNYNANRDKHSNSNEINHGTMSNLSNSSHTTHSHTITAGSGGGKSNLNHHSGSTSSGGTVSANQHAYGAQGPPQRNRTRNYTQEDIQFMPDQNYANYMQYPNMNDNKGKRPHSNTRDNSEIFKIPRQLPGAASKVPHSLVVHTLKQTVTCYWFGF